MITYLVTGGAGFIGSNLVEHILDTRQAVKVVVIDKMTYASHKKTIERFSTDSRLEIAKGDIADRDFVLDVFNKTQPNVVFHAAAESHVDRSLDDPYVFVRSNVKGTWCVVNAALKLKELHKLVHISTDEVFGSTISPVDSFTESSPYNPTTPYAASKAASDHIVRSYVKSYRLPAVVTNCSNNYGPYQFAEKFIPKMIMSAIRGDKLTIHGNGTHIRDWIYVTDHCEALLTVAESGVYESYNIGAQTTRSSLEIIAFICSIYHRLTGKTIESLVSYVEDRPANDKRYSLDVSRIKSLGWKPRVSLVDGLERTIRWYRDNYAWCEANYQQGLSRIQESS